MLIRFLTGENISSGGTPILDNTEVTEIKPVVGVGGTQKFVHHYVKLPFESFSVDVAAAINGSQEHTYHYLHELETTEIKPVVAISGSQVAVT